MEEEPKLSDETRAWLIELAERTPSDIGPPRILKIAGLGEYKEMDWDEKLTWNLIKAYDSIKKAIDIIDARKPKGQRVMEQVLKIAKAILYIAGAYCAKRL